MDKTYILAQNLSSVVDSALLPSTITASSNVYGGTLQFNMKLNPLKDKPTFDLNADLKNIQLPKLNEFFQEYANFDVNKGTLGLYTEIAAKLLKRIKEKSKGKKITPPKMKVVHKQSDDLMEMLKASLAVKKSKTA